MIKIRYGGATPRTHPATYQQGRKKFQFDKLCLTPYTIPTSGHCGSVNCGCESLLVIRLGKILNSTSVPAHFSRHRSVTPGWLLHFPLKLPIWLDNRYVGRVLFCNPTRIFNKFFQRGYQRNLKEPNIQDKSPHIPHAWIESISFNKVKFKFCQENWQMGRRQNMSEALNIRVLSCLGRSNAGYWHQNKW